MRTCTLCGTLSTASSLQYTIICLNELCELWLCLVTFRDYVECLVLILPTLLFSYSTELSRVSRRFRLWESYVSKRRWADVAYTANEKYVLWNLVTAP